MTEPDSSEFHLEALRDAELAGELSPADRARLDAHVRSCEACQLERMLHADASDGDEKWDDVFANVAAELALDAEPRSGVERGTWRVAAAALVAVGVATGGVAAASQSAWVRRAFETVFEAAPVADAGVPARRDERQQSPRSPEPVPPEPLEEPSEPESAEGLEASESVPPAPRNPVRRPRPPRTEQALFQDAGEARRAGRTTAAMALYRELIERFPSGNRAATARVRLGQMYLGRGSARSALSQYEAYLASRPSGSLAEEAMWGRARALRALGRRDAERGAWRDLVRAFPNSLHAAEARSRL